MPIYQLKNVSKNSKIAIWKITETEEELLQLINNKEADTTSVLKIKNKQLIKQRIVTRLLLNEFFKGEPINYDSLGKPLLNNGWYISISHSNEFVAINLNPKKNCGIDIEKITPKIERIKHKFLNPLDLKNVTDTTDLTVYWGAKEALYKYYGKKEVLFIENLFIENFSIQSPFFKGKINLKDFKAELQMAYEKIEDYILVYTL